MRKFYTNTNATFVTADGQTVSYKETFDSIKKGVEIYGNTSGRILSADDLEDLFQDAVYKALKSSHTFNPQIAKARTWASGILRNCRTDAYLRVVKHNATTEPLVSYNQNGDEYIDPAIESMTGGHEASREMESREALDRINAAMASLSEKFQLVLSLCEDGMKPRHMAELIGCTPDAAATLLCRARKALKNALGSKFLSQYGIAA